MILLQWWISLGQEAEPFDATLWHKRKEYWPRRDCENGRLLTKYVWRRQHNGKWEYKHREETTEEWLDRMG